MSYLVEIGLLPAEHPISNEEDIEELLKAFCIKEERAGVTRLVTSGKGHVLLPVMDYLGEF